MKKLIVLLSVILFAIAINMNNSFCQDCKLQKATDVPNHDNTVYNLHLKSTGDSPKSFDTIWYESFGNGMPAGWQVNDATGNNFNWIYSTDGPTGAYTGNWPNPEPALQSTTSSDGFLMLPSDFYNTTSGGVIVPTVVTMNATIQTTAINCSNYDGVILTFQQKFRYCCSESAAVFKVFVSINGTTWTGYDVRHGYAANIFSADPDTVQINISAIAANQPTVYLKWQQAGISHYYWMIDDVALLVAKDNDIDITTVKEWCIKETSGGAQSPDGHYSQIPVSQAMKMNFSGTVLNFGCTAQHNIALDVEVKKDNQTQFTAQNSIASLAVGASQNIIMPSPYFTPDELGSYTVSYHAQQSETDQNLTNNTGEDIVFETTVRTFARDHSETDYLSPDLYTGGADGDGFGVNYFNTYPSTVSSISVYITWQSSTGPTIKAQLYRFQGSTRVLQTESAVHTITFVDLGDWVELPLIPVNQGDDSLQANTRYVAFVQMNYGFYNLYIGADNVGTHDYNIETALRIGTNWYSISSVPMIHLNLATSCGNFVVDNSVSMTNCYTCQDGAVDLIVSGGTPGYSYQWSTGETTQDIDSLLSGTYHVTVTDTLGCVLVQDVNVGVDLQPCQTDGGFENMFDFSSDFCPWTTCDGDGSNTSLITGVSFPGNGAPMSFISFNPDATTPPYTGAAPHSGQRFAACITSQSSANNDWLISPHYLLMPNSTLSFWVKSQTNQYGLERYVVLVSTYGNNTQDFTPISPMPYLTAPYEAWTQVNFDLSAYGGDSVYIAIQCISNHAFMFMVDDFVITPTPQQNLSCVIQSTDATCYGLNNGKINLTPIGGVTPYTYHWSNGATTQDINGLSPGIYYVTIHSANSDIAYANATVGEPAEIILSFDITCTTGNNGAVDLSVTGGFSPYTCHWSNGSINEDISGLIPGNYLVTVTDSNQCVVTGSAQVILGISDNDPNHGYYLGQNFPNPFSGITNIPVMIPFDSEIEISLFTALGVKCSTIYNGHLSKAEHLIKFNSAGFSPGIYIIKFRSPEVQLYRLVNIER
jgi:hypothetical protein